MDVTTYRDERDYDTFIGEVQNRGQLSSREDTVRATRITLETLSQRIEPGSTENLAAQLPDEIGRHLSKVFTVETFEWEEFATDPSKRETTLPKTDAGTPSITPVL